MPRANRVAVRPEKRAGQTGLCLSNRKTTGLALGSAPSRGSLTRADV